MRRSIIGMMVVGVLLAATGPLASADDAKDEAIRKDRKLIEGTWRVVALEIDGNKAAEEDARKYTVLNAGETWSLLAVGKEVAKGTNSFDPTKKPKAIDFTITDGDGKGSVHLGIYELGEKSRRLCFAPAGKDRPTEFASPPGSDLVLVTLEREK
jgi:uncharacterized protein (TIGR03067 family)